MRAAVLLGLNLLACLAAAGCGAPKRPTPADTPCAYR